MSTQDKISADQVVERILDLIAAIPEAAEGLPDGCRTKEFWTDLFARNKRSRRLLECLQEVPAFTNQAPSPGDAAGWRKLMEKDFNGPPAARPKQASIILKYIVTVANEKPYVRPPKKHWRDHYSPDEKLQRVRPTESNEYIHNPHRGTTTFQRFQGDDTYASWITSDTHGPLEFDPEAPVRDNVKYVPRTTLSYCRWPWGWLEPKKGKYRWDLVDQALKTAHNRGQTLQVRLQPYTQRVEFADEVVAGDSAELAQWVQENTAALHKSTAKRHPPKCSVNVPDWLWDTGAAWLDKDSPGTYAPGEPDCNDPQYIKHYSAFIRAFARRYDGHEDLESVDVVYGGFWGEGGGNATTESGCKIVDVFLRSFRKTPLLLMLSSPTIPHARKKTRRDERPLGWRTDCFGDLHGYDGPDVPAGLNWNHTFDAYPPGIATDLGDAWMKGPVTMETCGNVATFFLEDYDVETIFREGMRYHMSVFMPKSVFYPQAIRDKFIEFEKKIGYRFVLRQLLLPLECTAGEPLPLRFFIDNVGCAPIYRPYSLALRFTQGSTQKVVRLKVDIRNWMPGHTSFEEVITTPGGFSSGEVKLDLAIVDQKDQPKVWFAITEKSDDGWHPMTSIDLVV